MKKVLTVIGARPQFIKAAAVSRAFRKVSGIQEVLVHTGQHYDANMSDIFFSELEIPRPTHNLGVGSSSHAEQTGKMLSKLEAVMRSEKPDAVLVYGDTNSTLAGALCAAKLHIPVAHVEAGLRSFNRKMPEEINRVLTDHVSRWLFAPTETAVRNLESEGIRGERVQMVGDVMYDVALFSDGKSRADSTIRARLDLGSKPYVLATIHRAENTDVPERLKSILLGLIEVSREIPVVLPLHPRTQKLCEPLGLLKGAPGSLRLLEPVGYLDMIALERDASVIATDSGGVQKEAFFFTVPCVTLRDETEWTELVELGWNHVVPPTSAQEISSMIKRLIGHRGRSGSPYGRGDSSAQIVDVLARIC